MKKEDKSKVISQLKDALGQYSHFYVTDTSGLNAERTYVLRKIAFNKT